MTEQSRHEVAYLTTELDGSVYFVPGYALHRPAAKRILAGKYYEPKTHRFVAQFFDTLGTGSMIHAGTFFGDMLPRFSAFVPSRVYAFEPVLENYILANLCVQANNLTNVFLFNAALGESIDILRIDTKGDDGAHAGGRSKIGTTGQLCPVVALDMLGVDDLALIQLDVEGFERAALTGARQVIASQHPTIAVEDNASNCAPFLTGLGYQRTLTIPGLTIWKHPERPDLAAAVDRCAATLG